METKIMQVSSQSVLVSTLKPGDTYLGDGLWLAVDPAHLPPQDGNLGFVRLTDGYYRESALTATVNKVTYQAGPA
jgi:hypothetical protein